MRSKWFLIALLFGLGPLMCAASVGPITGEATYLSFAVPGAFGTFPMGINASMEVTGYYNVTPTNVIPGITRAFLRKPDGTILTFDVHGNSTWAMGINSAGDITGFAEGESNEAGFLRYAHGRLVEWDSDLDEAFYGILPFSINDYDETAGYLDLKFPEPFWQTKNGVITALEYPDPYHDVAQASAINNGGSVVGYSIGPDESIGFVAHPDGYWAKITVPPADSACLGETIPEGINASGMVAGFYTTAYYNLPGCTPRNAGGFVMSPDGKLTLFPLEGSSPPTSEWDYQLPYSTSRMSIDEAGNITGFYPDAAGVTHDFVRNPYGTMTSFHPPEGKETYPTSINDGGVIAGYYLYKKGADPAVGFIRIP